MLNLVYLEFIIIGLIFAMTGELLQQSNSGIIIGFTTTIVGVLIGGRISWVIAKKILNQQEESQAKDKLYSENHLNTYGLLKKDGVKCDFSIRAIRSMTLGSQRTDGRTITIGTITHDVKFKKEAMDWILSQGYVIDYKSIK